MDKNHISSQIMGDRILCSLNFCKDKTKVRQTRCSEYAYSTLIVKLRRRVHFIILLLRNTYTNFLCTFKKPSLLLQYLAFYRFACLYKRLVKALQLVSQLLNFFFNLWCMTSLYNLLNIKHVTFYIWRVRHLAVISFLTSWRGYELAISEFDYSQTYIRKPRKFQTQISKL